MAIKVDMLKCFIAVASHGSLAQAAEALGRTPSAISMMLKQFEDHLGSALFKTARKSRLTPFGDTILAEARRGIAHLDHTVSVIEALSRSELGHLRLVATPSVAGTLLPAVVAKFIAAFPNVQIDLRDMDSAAIAKELELGHADIGIGTLPDVDSMQRSELFSDAFGVVCRKDHALAQTWEPKEWRSIGDWPMISNGLCDWIEDPDIAQHLAQSRLMVRNTASLLGLVRQGVGITILPRLVVTGFGSDLAFLPLETVLARRAVHIMSRPDQHLPPAGREFLHLVQDMTRDGSLQGSGFQPA